MNRHQRRAGGLGRTAQGESDAMLQALALGDKEAAERLARSALRRQASHPIALHVLSTVLFDKGAHAEVATLAERGLKTGRGSPELCALAARAHAINGNLDRAIELFEKAVASLPDDANLRAQFEFLKAEQAGVRATRAALQAAATDQRDDADLLAQVAQRFDRAIDGFGASPTGILHDDADLHRRTFDVLLDVVDAAGRDDVSVQDLGCGYGALFEILATRAWFARGRYVGLDVASQMIESARARIDDPRATFAQGSELHQDSDVVIVAGTWNFKLNASDDEWQRYVRKSLANVARHARNGFAFNLLHRGAADSANLFATTPDVWLAACEELGFRSVLRDEYSQREFSVLARRA